MDKKEAFKKYVEKWKALTYLGWWEVTVNYYNAQEFYKAFDQSTVDTAANCNSNWQYMNAQINVNLGKLAELTEEEIETVVVHEIMHIFLNEMRQEGIEHEERVVTVLARSFMLAARGGK